MEEARAGRGRRVKRGRHVSIPEGPDDLGSLWETASRLAGDSLPPWLSVEDGQAYRRIGSVSLAGLSETERQAAERELEECELARLIVGDDPRDKDLRHVYIAAPRPEAVWSIGMLKGASPCSLGDAPVENPLLTAAHVTDVPASSVADPFLLRRDDRWWMFFEVVNWRTWKGEIGLASSSDGLAWRYERIVLAEPFHLSYPYVFEADGAVYMIPESSQIGSVRLYRARRFPWEWEHQCDLLGGMPFADTSLIRHGGRWWLFTETSGGGDDTLRLFHAADVHGPYVEHPRSPIVAGDGTIGRPAGRIVPSDGRLVRFAQSCLPAYGTDVRGLEITCLTPDDYAEAPIGDGPILGPAGTGWNAGGMHHVDPIVVADGAWLAAVDGWRWSPDPEAMPASEPLAAALQPLFAGLAPAGGPVRILSRRPNEYASSARTEIVTLALPSGASRDVFVKYGRGGADPAPRVRHGIEYCAAVQRHLVATLPISHVAPLGLVQVGDPPVAALACDFVADSLRVGEAPDDSGIVAAAEWCGRFHAWGETARHDPALAFLVRYDLDYYRSWGDRARAVAAALGPVPPWLDRLCGTWTECATTLMAARPTTIHGELGPQNVLWKGGEILPVDWESAAVAAGEIDLAALVFGWPTKTVEACVDAYWRARGIAAAPGFADTWATATLYTALRWVPLPRPGQHAASAQALVTLEKTARALALLGN